MPRDEAGTCKGCYDQQDAWKSKQPRRSGLDRWLRPSGSGSGKRSNLRSTD